MQRVILLGDMGQRFGETWEMNVDYIRDIFKLIGCQREGFNQYLIDCHENGTNFTMQRGEEFVGEEELHLSVGNEDIIITPIPAGSKSGIGKILLAIAIVVAVIVIPGAMAAAASFGTVSAGSAMAAIATSTVGMMAISMAASLAMAGINQMMMPGPEMDKETPDNYLFNGSSEHIKEGLPIPLCYGEMMVGGGVINQTLSTQKLYSQGMRRSTAALKDGDFHVTPPGGLA